MADINLRRDVLAQMIRSRTFEECLKKEFAAQREHAKGCFGGRNSAFEEYNREFRIPIQGNLELSIGQEAAQTAICAWLSEADYAAGTHRTHALALAKGVRTADILAEIYGKQTGLCGGRGGDFMLNDSRVNYENSVIMAQLTSVALGFAFAFKRAGSQNIATVFIGDGASNQGVVHEAMNLASAWKLPVVFVIEDNHYAISATRHASSAVSDLSLRAIGYDMPGRRIDDRSVDELIDTFGEVVTRAREGGGPSLVVVRTRRLEGAFEGDTQQYRPAGELQAEWADDSLAGYSKLLVDQGVVTQEWISGLQASAAADFAAGLEAAIAAPYPDPKSAELGVFA